MGKQTRRELLKKIGFAASSLAGLSAFSSHVSISQAAVTDQKRPNVIIIMTDDQGYGDFSCHGNPVLKTPNFDILHGQSVRLTDFHVAPMCAPTRSQLMSGLDALRNKARHVCGGL
ncbi:MAG: sulfatase-like hydrolase/transferase, partial [Planctomycetota bacterium]